MLGSSQKINILFVFIFLSLTMTEKKTQAHGSAVPAEEVTQAKTVKSTPASKKPAQAQK